MAIKNLFDALSGCATEEEVKFNFASFFRIKLDTKKKIDLYTPQILFEFKLDGEFFKLERRARAFAQSLYYIRRLKFGDDTRAPSRSIAVVDKHSAAIIPTERLENYCRSNKYDWDRAPSTPCKILIDDLIDDRDVRECRVFDFSSASDVEHFLELIRREMWLYPKKTIVVKEINENNFWSIFEEWDKRFGASVANSHKPSEYFLTDIELGSSDPIDNGKSVLFRLHDGQTIEKQMPIDLYKTFWRMHAKVGDARTMLVIRQKMDRMTTIELRRFTGEFFTPIEHARLALKYLERLLGEEWWSTGEYRLWDPAAGTGNLEFPLPIDALKFCYVSTLLSDDAAYCRKLYPEATVFQYDFLNDGEEKLPPKLRAELDDPTLKWIVLVNPPYATASNFQNFDGKTTKYGVSFTAVQQMMKADGLGEVSRELSSQFLFRIDRMFRDRSAILGLISKIKYINAPLDQRLRDRFFDYKFEGGFVFPSKHFQGTKGAFPVGFLMWRLDRHAPLSEQTIELDVFNDRLQKVGTKKIVATMPGDLLNNWIERPKAVKKFPPFSSALKIARDQKDRRDGIAEGFIAALMTTSNDFMHRNYTALLSGMYVGMGALSIVEANFERAMIIHAVRRLPRASWLNDRDQFFRPSTPLPSEFVSDCAVWSLFSTSNQTVSLVDVEYEGELWRVKNNLFPFSIAELSSWRCSVLELFYPLAREKDRFAAEWLRSKKLSTEAEKVLIEARSIYKKFYERLNDLDRKKYLIEAWDAGWYQIRKSLEDAKLFEGERLKEAFDRLSEKLLPQIYSLGFLRDEVKYFD